MVYSFKYQENRQYHSFMEDVADAERVIDSDVDSILREFLKITHYDTIQLNSFSINVIEFPKVFSWQGLYDNSDDDFDILSDYIGLAWGMDNDEIVDIYLRSPDWEELSFAVKKKVLYHELLHDCYNLEHDGSICGIMAAETQICETSSADEELKTIINDLIGVR